MKLQVFVHGIDVVEDILHYPGDDAHCICVMEVPLQAERQFSECNHVKLRFLLKNKIHFIRK